MLIYREPDLNDEALIVEWYEKYLNAGPAIREYVREGLRDSRFAGVK